MVVANPLASSLTCRQARSLSVGGKLAALTGAAGAALSGEAVAEGINYVPTAAVVAAQGIPGFSFDASTSTLTPGTPRPPASEGSTNGWDVDDDGTDDFVLQNIRYSTTVFAKLSPFALFANPDGVLRDNVAPRFSDSQPRECRPGRT